MNSPIRVVLSYALLGLSFSFAFAADDDSVGKVMQKPVAADSRKADTPETFAAVQKWVLQQMDSKGRYEFLSAADKAKVQVDMETMSSMIQKAGSVAAMPKEDQVKLFNMQEHLNGILTHNDSNRLICQQVAPVGSHIQQTKCNTLAELRRQQNETNQYMQNKKSSQGNCSSPGVCYSGN